MHLYCNTASYCMSRPPPSRSISPLCNIPVSADLWRPSRNRSENLESAPRRKNTANERLAPPFSVIIGQAQVQCIIHLQYHSPIQRCWWWGGIPSSALGSGGQGAGDLAAMRRPNSSSARAEPPASSPGRCPTQTSLPYTARIEEK